MKSRPPTPSVATNLAPPLLLAIASLLLAATSALAQVGSRQSTGGGVTHVSGPLSRLFPSSWMNRPFTHNGLLRLPDGQPRGSAVCAANERVVLSAAHLAFLEGRWLNGLRFHPWSPWESENRSLRGQWVLAGYAEQAALRTSGKTSDAHWNRDFAAFYAYERLADPAPSFTDSTAALGGTAQKMITGYPALIEFTGTSQPLTLHATLPFRYPFTRIYSGFFEVGGVATGPGNSGGPVWVLHEAPYRLPRWTMAGIVLGGTSNSVAVRRLDYETDALIRNAVLSAHRPASAVTTRSCGNGVRATLPDGPWSESNAGWTVRSFHFNGMPFLTTRVTISLDVSTTYRGDLDVYLRSPRGRTFALASHRYDSRNNLVLHEADCSGSFYFTNPNGEWKLYMRDYYRGDIATFNSATLKVTAW